MTANAHALSHFGWRLFGKLDTRLPKFSDDAALALIGALLFSYFLTRMLVSTPVWLFCASLAVPFAFSVRNLLCDIRAENVCKQGHERNCEHSEG